MPTLRSLSLVTLLLGPSFAQTVRIDFDAFPGPDGMLGTVDDIPIVGPASFAAQSMQVTDEFMPLGIRFIPNPALDDKNEILNGSAFSMSLGHSPPNVFASSGTLTIEAEFTVHVHRVQALIGIGDGTDQLQIYDAAGNLLGAVAGDGFEVELASPYPIARIVIRTNSPTTPVIDNLRFDVSPFPIGTTYCSPAVPNTTGTWGRIYATGSTEVASNDVRLRAAWLPINSFGYFITSRTQAHVPNAGGSHGVLCLGGGTIGRFVGQGQVQNTGQTGSFTLQLDLTRMPTPTALVAAAAGETWNFQAWHRDFSGVGASNFTEAVAITF